MGPVNVNAPFNDLLPEYFADNPLNDLLTYFLVDSPLVEQLYGITPGIVPPPESEITQAGPVPASGSTPITPPQIIFIYPTSLPPGIDSTSTVTIANGAVVTPEPGTLLLLATGLGALAIGWRFKSSFRRPKDANGKPWIPSACAYSGRPRFVPAGRR